MKLEDIKDPTQLTNLQRYLTAVAACEGADYNTIVGNGKFDDFSKHPGKVGLVTKDGPSTAAGRYQITKSTYNDTASKLGISDFTPESQDRIAVALINRRGALQDVLNGDFNTANNKLGSEWQGLPTGVSKNQGRRSQDYFDQALNLETKSKYSTTSFDQRSTDTGTTTPRTVNDILGTATGNGQAPALGTQSAMDLHNGYQAAHPPVAKPQFTNAEENAQLRATASTISSSAAQGQVPSDDLLIDTRTAQYDPKLGMNTPALSADASRTNNALLGKNDTIKNDYEFSQENGFAVKAGAAEQEALHSTLFRLLEDSSRTANGGATNFPVTFDEKIKYLSDNPGMTTEDRDDLMTADDADWHTKTARYEARQQNFRTLGADGFMSTILPGVVGDPLGFVIGAGFGKAAEAIYAGRRAIVAARTAQSASQAVRAGVAESASHLGADIANAAAEAAASGAAARAGTTFAGRAATTIAGNIVGNEAASITQAALGEHITSNDYVMQGIVGLAAGTIHASVAGLWRAGSSAMGKQTLPDGRVVYGPESTSVHNPDSAMVSMERWLAETQETRKQQYVEAAERLVRENGDNPDFDITPQAITRKAVDIELERQDRAMDILLADVQEKVLFVDSTGKPIYEGSEGSTPKTNPEDSANPDDLTPFRGDGADEVVHETVQGNKITFGNDGGPEATLVQGVGKIKDRFEASNKTSDNFVNDTFQFDKDGNISGYKPGQKEPGVSIKSLSEAGVRTKDDLKLLAEQGAVKPFRPEINGNDVRSGKRMLMESIDKFGKDSYEGQIAARLVNILGDNDIPVRLLANDLKAAKGQVTAGNYNALTDSITLSKSFHNDPRLVLHEMTHAATKYKLAAAMSPNADPKLKAAVVELDSIREAVRNRMKADGETLDVTSADGHAKNYALTNNDELLSVVFSDRNVADWMARTPWQATGKQTLREKFVSTVRKILGMKETDENALSRILELGDQIARSKGDFELQVDSSGAGSVNRSNLKILPPDVKKYGLETMSDMDKAIVIAEMTKNAEAANAKYPIDMARARTIMSKLPKPMQEAFESSAGIMVKSNNPMVRYAGNLLAESAVGASERHRTLSIDLHMMRNLVAERFIPEYHRSFDMFIKETGRSKLKAVLMSEAERDFNGQVYKEQMHRYRNRDNPDAPESKALNSVKLAANANEAAYERMLKWQKKAKVPGWEALPETARGYMPRSLDSNKLYDAIRTDPGLRTALNANLERQMIDELGFDKAFAKEAAAKYWEHGINRAAGVQEVPAIADGGAFSQHLRAALEASGMSRTDIEARLAVFDKARGSHLKHRLDIDIDQSIINPETGKSYNMADLFQQDQTRLLQNYTNRVSGYVALAQRGILGDQGISMMLEGAAHGKTPASLHEIKTMQMLFNEITGRPFGHEGNEVLASLRTLTAITKLGGMSFAQAAESLNALGHIGLLSTIKTMPGIRNVFEDVRAGKRNNIIESIEYVGGGFDTPEKYLWPHLDGNTMDVINPSTMQGMNRLLKKYGRATSIMNFHKMLVTAQLRAVSQQIVLKSLREIVKGDVMTAPMRDMGFTQRMIDGVRADMKNIATFDADGRIKSLDVTRTKNPEIMNEYIQSVHRGTRQIIQGKFIGESGHYVHSGFLSLLAQFRSFGILAAEKQLARQVSNVGALAVTGLMVSQMILAMPIAYARMHVAAAGMSQQKRDEYIARRWAPGSMLSTMMNMTSLTGLLNEPINFALGLFNAGSSTRTGGKTSLLGNVPALGMLEGMYKAGNKFVHDRDMKSLVAFGKEFTHFDTVFYTSWAFNMAAKDK